MNLPRIQISIRDLATVWVNGTELRGIRSVAVDHKAGEPPVVVLELIAECVDVDTQAVLAPHIERLVQLERLHATEQSEAPRQAFRTHDTPRANGQ